MTRVFLGVIFASTTIVFALFLWQKQLKSYNFSFGKEKQSFQGFGDVIKELKESLPSKDRMTEDLKAFEATTTLESATSTE